MPGLAGEQVAREQLEVVEVDAAARALGRGVGVGVAAQQLVDERERRDRANVGAAPWRRPRRPRGRRRRRASSARSRCARPSSPSGRSARRRRAPRGTPRAPRGRRRRPRRRPAARARPRTSRTRAPARRARRRRRPRARRGSDGRVCPRERSSSWAPTTIRSRRSTRVGGGEVERVGARRGQEVGQRGVEGLRWARAPVGGSSTAKRRVEPGGHGVGAQDPRAEAVEGRDPRRPRPRAPPRARRARAGARARGRAARRRPSR